MTAAPDPTPVLESLDGFRRSKAMFAALELGVFERLEQGAATADQLAKELSLNADAAERLLDACVGSGLLAKQGGTYANNATASTYLVRTSANALVGYIDYSNRVGYRMWGDLETAIRKGTHLWETTYGLKGDIFAHFFKSDEAKRTFLMGMHGMGMLSSPRVVEMFDLSRFTIEAVRRHPKLRGTIFDLPPVVAVAREFIDRSPDKARLDTVAGDFFKD